MCNRTTLSFLFSDPLTNQQGSCCLEYRNGMPQARCQHAAKLFGEPSRLQGAWERRLANTWDVRVQVQTKTMFEPDRFTGTHRGPSCANSHTRRRRQRRPVPWRQTLFASKIGQPCCRWAMCAHSPRHASRAEEAFGLMRALCSCVFVASWRAAVFAKCKPLRNPKTLTGAVHCLSIGEWRGRCGMAGPVPGHRACDHGARAALPGPVH